MGSMLSYIYIYSSTMDPMGFKWFFHTWSFFFLLSFFQALASHLHQRIHRDHFWYQKLSFSSSFCYRSWFLCAFLFSGNCCNHQKKSVATTQAPSLCRIWHAFVGTPLRRQTMKWRNQKHYINSCRTTGFQESGHRSFTEPTFNVIVSRFFSSYRFFEWKQKMAHGGSWKTKRIGAGFLQNPDMVLHAWAILGGKCWQTGCEWVCMLCMYVCIYIYK